MRVTNEFTKINFPITIGAVKTYIEKEKNTYRNRTDFIDEYVRIRRWDIRRADIDQRKLLKRLMRVAVQFVSQSTPIDGDSLITRSGAIMTRRN